MLLNLVPSRRIAGLLLRVHHFKSRVHVLRGLGDKMLVPEYLNRLQAVWSNFCKKVLYRPLNLRYLTSKSGKGGPSDVHLLHDVRRYQSSSILPAL